MSRERKALELRLDALWAKAVKLIGRCELCGKVTTLEAHHIQRRDNRATRWDLMNGVCLCREHHTANNVVCAHGTNARSVEMFKQWLLEYKGEEYIQDLTARSNSISKFSISDLKELEIMLKEFIGSANKC